MNRLKPGTFTQMPRSALADARLTGRHFRVLGVIAYHDRAAANGRGCYAAQSTIAREAKMYRQDVNKCIADLVEWGHLKIVRGGKGRVNEITVIYSDPTCRGNATSYDGQPVMNTTTGSEEEPVGETRHVYPQPVGETRHRRIYTSEGEGYCAEAPSAGADVCKVLSIPNDGGFVREAEKILRAAGGLGSEAREKILERLEEIAGDEWQLGGLAGWAQRVFEEFLS